MKIIAIAAAIAAGISISALPAAAADFTTKIVQIDGRTPMKNADNTDTTLLDIAKVALLSSYQDEQNLSGVEKYRRFWLARKIETSPKDPDLSVDEVKLIKDLVAKAYNPLVTGQAWLILDPTSAPKN